MKLYCIIDPKKNSKTKSLLQKACIEKSVDYVEIDIRSNKFDFVNCPRPAAGDCLYRVIANDKNAKKIEFALIKDSIATFYADNSHDYIFRPHAGIKLEKFGIPVPKTIPVITSDRDILKIYAEALGGFPIIIKAMGGKEGVGVMRVDSSDSLYSVADYLYKQDEDFILREYIDVRESIRLVVLGEKVIACMKYKALAGKDFRSNRRTPLDNAEIFDASAELQKLAVDSVKCMGLEFGGVDILLDKNNKPYVLEVNSPFNFVEAQEFTKIDIAGLAVEHLIKKAEAKK